MNPLSAVLACDPRIAYALKFGSRTRGEAPPHSDLDLALGLEPGVRLTVAELGELAAELESVSGHAVDLVLLEQAPPALAYRIFAEGELLLERNHAALVERKTRAILEYLDFAPTEALCARGVIAATADGR